MKKLMMLVLAGMFSAGIAVANEGAQQDFSKLDKDGDGQLSRTEVAQDSELAAQFSTIDADGDGYLAETEVQNASMENTGMESQDPALQETGAEDPALQETGAEEDTSSEQGSEEDWK